MKNIFMLFSMLLTCFLTQALAQDTAELMFETDANWQPTTQLQKTGSIYNLQTHKTYTADIININQTNPTTITIKNDSAERTNLAVIISLQQAKYISKQNATNYSLQTKYTNENKIVPPEELAKYKASGNNINLSLQSSTDKDGVNVATYGTCSNGNNNFSAKQKRIIIEPGKTYTINLKTENLKDPECKEITENKATNLYGLRISTIPTSELAERMSDVVIVHKYLPTMIIGKEALIDAKSGGYEICSVNGPDAKTSFRIMLSSNLLREDLYAHSYTYDVKFQIIKQNQREGYKDIEWNVNQRSKVGPDGVFTAEIKGNQVAESEGFVVSENISLQNGGPFKIKILSLKVYNQKDITSQSGRNNSNGKRSDAYGYQHYKDLYLTIGCPGNTTDRINGEVRTKMFRVDVRPKAFIITKKPNVNELYAGFSYPAFKNTNGGKVQKGGSADWDKVGSYVDGVYQDFNKASASIYSYIPDYNVAINEIEGNTQSIAYLGDQNANKNLLDVNFPANYNIIANNLDFQIQAIDDNNELINHYAAPASALIVSKIYNKNQSNDTNCIVNKSCQEAYTYFYKGEAKRIFTNTQGNINYLKFNNVGPTRLFMRDSEFTAFSQSKGLCVKGSTSNQPNAQGLIGCDIGLFESADEANRASHSTADIGVDFFTFKPAMMKIYTQMENSPQSNYSSKDWTLYRGKCSQFINAASCKDDLEMAGLKITVGALGANISDIKANNFLSRYDGTKASNAGGNYESTIVQGTPSLKGHILNPIISYSGTTPYNEINDFKLILSNDDIKKSILLLAPKYKQDGTSSESGDAINEINYLAKAGDGTAGKLATTSPFLPGQTSWYDLAAASNHNDINLNIYASSFKAGKAELINIKKEAGKDDKEFGMFFNQTVDSLAPSAAKKISLTKDDFASTAGQNAWLQTDKISSMVENVGDATFIDAAIIAPDQQVTSANKDNAVFYGVYVINEPYEIMQNGVKVTKYPVDELTKAGIIGDIIPGYKNYYRLILDDLPDLKQPTSDQFFNYFNVSSVINPGRNLSGDFLTIQDPNSESVAYLKGNAPQPEQYCNFIRNCYKITVESGNALIPTGTYYGTVFKGFANKAIQWNGSGKQGTVLLPSEGDSTNTHRTQRRLAW